MVFNDKKKKKKREITDDYAVIVYKSLKGMRSWIPAHSAQPLHQLCPKILDIERVI